MARNSRRTRSMCSFRMERVAAYSGGRVCGKEKRARRAAPCSWRSESAWRRRTAAASRVAGPPASGQVSALSDQSDTRGGRRRPTGWPSRRWRSAPSFAPLRRTQPCRTRRQGRGCRLRYAAGGCELIQVRLEAVGHETCTSL